jgi:hypothetical protein
MHVCIHRHFHEGGFGFPLISCSSHVSSSLFQHEKSPKIVLSGTRFVLHSILLRFLSSRIDTRENIGSQQYEDLSIVFTEAARENASGGGGSLEGGRITGAEGTESWRWVR